jgi:glutathione peroxidase
MCSFAQVNGVNTDPVFVYLKNFLPGLLGSKEIKWNFTKFLIDKNGTPYKRFAPTDEPKNIITDIVKLLK